MTGRFSVVINNYNYAPFLRDAIDSALGQTDPDVEVVVVDDGSTDASREIIESYEARVVSVFQPNSGQGAAFNAGLTSSSGEIVLFLDADDVLVPGAATRIAERFEPGVTKVHWPSWELEGGQRTGRLRPEGRLPEGDVLPALRHAGPWSFTSPPTSGNAWRRSVLEAVAPIAEADFRICADFYLATLAPVYGEVRRILEPQTLWRRHASNQFNTAAEPLAARTAEELVRYEAVATSLAEHLSRRGVYVDPRVWKERNHRYKRYVRVAEATRLIEELVPEGSSFVLVDDGDWRDGVVGRQPIVGGRQALYLFDDGGEHPRDPADVAEIAHELDRLRRRGASHVFFVWPATWWLTHYAALAGVLESIGERVHRRWDVAAYALVPPTNGTRASARRPELIAAEAKLESLSSERARLERELYRLREVDELLDAVRAATPPRSVVAVASKGDDDLVGFEARTGWHFPQNEGGSFLGYHPADSDDAIRHLKRLEERGAQFLAFPRSSLWWLDHYEGFARYVNDRGRVVVNTPAAKIFALRA